MSTKTKAFGLCLLVVALAALPGTAGGDVGGHFVYEVANPKWKAEESTFHRLEFKFGSGAVICPEGDFQGSETTNTTTAIYLQYPAQEKCMTTGGAAEGVPINFNGCAIGLTIGKKATNDNTTNISCPFLGKKPYIEVTHPNCLVRIPGQSVPGISYSRFEENGKHIITFTFTEVGGPSLTVHYEGGICIFLGTTHTGAITGALTFKAFDEVGNLVDVTATGTEDPN